MLFSKALPSKDGDIIITSLPKSGTTWLKALIFAIVNRNHFSPSQNHPLLISNAHDLVPHLEFNLYEIGPFWTHNLGYWGKSKETPNKFLFLKYEELKGNIKFYLKRIAEFLNCPFDLEEEESVVVDKIIELCDFEKMKELEVNKMGKFMQRLDYKDFFRKGEVGDWVNHFCPWMEDKLSKVMEKKFSGSGLSF
ncbi:cytosolic sulfotransferase 8-like [Neltuma alba]|uniref:cytosolic sulfotransferase 8-like n=1 Tax=Neltuma alba TaxID=207710 RepID=UPI0010A54957|nr:cytosolic sulfotransferase 8-like [Prosopis alba]